MIVEWCLLAGPDDNVRCYFCDGGLKNWQPTDEPWAEHRRWFSRCPHLQMRPSMPEIPLQVCWSLLLFLFLLLFLPSIL